jgi:DNA-binding NarL/FixJ family response regulator
MHPRLILALAPDIFFGARVSDAARTLGYTLTRVATPDALLAALDASTPALVVVDLSAGTARLKEVARRAGSARLIAFGPHVDTASRDAARAAGFHEVVPNSRLAREGAALLARHLPETGDDGAG